MNNNLVNKLLTLKPLIISSFNSYIEAEKKLDRFDLFCLVELEDQIDIIISSKEFFDKSSTSNIDLISSVVHDILITNNIINISNVIVLFDNEPFYKELVKMKSKSYKNIKICDMPIKRLSIL